MTIERLGEIRAIKDYAGSHNAGFGMDSKLANWALERDAHAVELLKMCKRLEYVFSQDWCSGNHEHRERLLGDARTLIGKMEK